jgi:hypothetical protein
MISITIAFVVAWHNVQENPIPLVRSQVTETASYSREHASSSFGDDHFGAQFVEFIPQLFGF